MIELILALLLQLISPSADKNTNDQKKSDASAASTQSVSTQSTTASPTTTTQYDGGQNHWDTKD